MRLLRTRLEIDFCTVTVALKSFPLTLTKRSAKTKVQHKVQQAGDLNIHSSLRECAAWWEGPKGWKQMKTLSGCFAAGSRSWSCWWSLFRGQGRVVIINKFKWQTQWLMLHCGHFYMYVYVLFSLRDTSASNRVACFVQVGVHPSNPLRRFEPIHMHMYLHKRYR